MPDPTTQSNYLSIVTQHVILDWNVDFDRKVLSGSATHELLVRDIVVNEVVFDSGDLDISSVEVEGISVPFKLNERHPVMGSALYVPFVHPVPKGSKIKVRIAYTTSKDAIALQFLDKEQTQGKKFPYLFSQCQPIYARTLAPLQDTPSVKLTYTANVSSVLPVLMSAVRKSPLSDGPAHDGKVIGSDMVTYTYNQPTAIPSYLIALACGNVRYRSFPKEKSKEWSSGIWAEPELIDSAYWEFSADTNKFLAEEERIVGTYRFGVYDLLVLPPSFPYGGMSATHFWLNEGWTTYIERVLQEVLHSPAHRGFSFLIGYKAMQDALRQYEDRPKYQRLVIDFDVGEDPDDAYSSVPYEKGANFLLYLERLLGGLDVFLPYVRDYVNTFMGQSINTDIWKEHLYSYWRNRGDGSKVSLLDNIDWNAWFYGEGLTLPVEMEYDLTLAKYAYELAARWDASRVKDINSLNFKSNDLSDFDSNQKAVFLEKLQSYPALPSAHLTYLGNLYGLSETTNSELRFRYYELALLDTSIPVSKSFASDAARWVVGDDGTGIIKGRMKFCRPVLRAADRADPETTKKIFIANRDSFHPIARRLIEKSRDLTTQSNYLSVATEHVHFDWTIDFEEKLVYGSATHTLKTTRQTSFDWLDLEIQIVQVDCQDATFKLGDKHAVMGIALRVSLPLPIDGKAKLEAKFTHKMGKLRSPSNFSIKNKPKENNIRFYSANANRSTPDLLQDTASVKLFSFFSTVAFKSIPAPTYLIAIASGNVCYKPLPSVEGKEWSCGIWAEPELIDAAYWEFSEDTRRFLATEESVVCHTSSEYTISLFFRHRSYMVVWRMFRRMLGGPDVFVPYVRNYVNTFMGRSIDTDTWKRHLYEYWAGHGSKKVEVLDSIDWDVSSLLINTSHDIAFHDAIRLDQVVSALDFQASDLIGFDANQKVAFLERLQIYPTFPITYIVHVDSLYGVRTTSNAEIRFRFYELALLEPNAAPLDAKVIAEEAANWLVGEDGTGVVKGRMKFCRPVFRAVYRAEPVIAIKTFQEYKSEFHPIARRLIEKVSIA
ncbi:hypothetical protein A7U60_g3588 [Sanghuangporus baumii]|uniref:Peptidase M1 leukotriene A4 hydrolase/aminopeptidase C-terminal domain-containing protein n=1 Tax=Sanghuangporus baumii TaxID=108892 RepID=A0A9Q5NA02_SANBA|nr:hypothetical protein A7U60_g3588 [Sanghuangporus baumii]